MSRVQIQGGFSREVGTEAPIRVACRPWLADIHIWGAVVAIPLIIRSGKELLAAIGNPMLQTQLKYNITDAEEKPNK